MALTLDLMPGIGDGKGIVEALTGKGLVTGEKLSGQEGAAGSLAVLRWLKTGGKVLTAGAVRQARKGAEAGADCTGNSFLPGTPVLLADGSAVPIEQVREGGNALATDLGTGRTEAQPVTDLIVGEGERNLVTVTVDVDGDQGDRTASITATDPHPFWTGDLEQWTNASDLRPGMKLRTDAGALVRVVAVDSWTAPQQKVHNIVVAGAHTFHVLVGGTPVLAHQAGKNQAVQRDPGTLFEQLSRGNMNPGLGSKALTGTDVTYARGRNGGRLFFRNVGGGIQIVAKADKSNESTVIARLKQLYGK
ncbi:polymorphic toxin-type HINT domain-containing protein [Streptomyces sp. NPDC001135]